MRQVVTLYGVAETYLGSEPYVVVAVPAEVYATGYKLRIPDQDPDRIHALRAFRHGEWVWRHGNRRHGYSIENHLLTQAAAVQYFLRGLESQIDCAKENLTMKRAELRKARKVFA